MKDFKKIQQQQISGFIFRSKTTNSLYLNSVFVEVLIC